MAGSWTVTRVWGIPIKLHWTFLLVLPVFAYLMGQEYFGVQGQATMEEYLWGGALAVALFVCVVLHELGHSYVAQRFGVPIRGIMLLPIGGVAQMERMPEDPGEELRVAVAGPIVNFVIAAPIVAVLLLDLLPLGPGNARDFVYWFGYLNVFLGGFNLLIPAFPMDGGRILRSLLAHRMGLRKATEWAAAVGRGLAVVMGLLGFFSGAWLLLLIAVFIYLGASAEEQQVQASTTLGDLRAEDVMTSDPRTVAPGDTVAAVYGAMMETKHIAFPVVRDGAVVGVVSLHDLAGVRQDLHEATYVEDVMQRDIPSVDPGTRATELLQHLSQREDDRLLLVVDAAGLRGIVTRTDLMRLIRILEAEGREAGYGGGSEGPGGPTIEWVEEPGDPWRERR